MSNTNLKSKKQKGSGFSSAPRINNYNKSINIKEEQSGRSMIEMLGVLAIIGVLSVGGIAGYSKAMMKYRINKTIEQIALVAGNTRAFFGPQGHYAGLIKNSSYASNYTVIRKAKLVPDEMWNSAHTEPENAFGGLFYLTADTKGDNDRSDDIDENCTDGCDAFIIGLGGIPEEACIELASKDWSNISSNIIIEVYPEGGGIYNYVPPLDDLGVITNICTETSRNAFFSLHIDVDTNSNYWKGRLENCSPYTGGC